MGPGIVQFGTESGGRYGIYVHLIKNGEALQGSCDGILSLAQH